MRGDYAAAYGALHARHWWWRSREAAVLRRIRSFRLPPAARILDVGCGSGLLFGRLDAWGEASGIEADAALVAGSAHADRIRVGPFDASTAPREPVDLVLMLDVLEHIDDDAGALDLAFAATRPGGRLLLTVPALPALWSRHDEANEHRRRYRRGDLRGKLGRAGYRVDSIRYAFVWAALPLLVRRWVAPAGVVGKEYAVAIPPTPMNGLLGWISRVDHAVGAVVPWPVGSSLFVEATRPTTAGMARPRPRRHRRAAGPVETPLGRGVR